MFCRVPFHARRREINKIVFAALARIHPLHFAPTGAKPNEIVFAALARIHPLHFAPAGAKSNEIVFAALARVAKTPRPKRLGRCRQ